MSHRIAVVAHVFYPEIWPEIAAYLRKWRIDFRLYVTTPGDRFDRVVAAVNEHFTDAVIIATPNRGRDIGPFLACLPRVIGDGNDIVCKVHTKKSGHWRHGNRWRNALFDGVLGVRVGHILSAFALEPSLGILAPAGYLITHRAGWDSNGDCVMDLAGRLGSIDNLLPFRFGTGSMFWARTDALVPLLQLGITPDDFPEESGQTDGTLAHAIERLFPLSARIAGYETCDTSFLPTLTQCFRLNAAAPRWEKLVYKHMPWLRPRTLINQLRYRLRLRTRAKAMLRATLQRQP
jgi:lipopolysaccharide biosynthesis protein